MKTFKYPVEELIKAVKERPVLWDKTLDVYKDRLERRQAWEQIFRLLDAEFEELSRQERRAVGDIIINKWTNIRDTFKKSLKNQSTKSGVRRYLYHEEMSFLMKVIPEAIVPDCEELESDGPSGDPICNMELKQEISQDLSEGDCSIQEPRRKKKLERKRKYLEASPEPETRTRKKRSRKSETTQSDSEECPAVDFVDMVDTQDPRIMNEDEAFFASLLPTVVKYSEDERLEFRIEVLAVMKSINEKRRHKWNDENDD